MKTWGDVYYAHLRKGEDHGSAAYAADLWEKRMAKTTIPMTAVWSRRIGDYVETLVETNGEWKLAIREHIDGSFSHIAEGNGADKWKSDDK